MKLKTFFIVGIFLIFFSTALHATFEDRIVAIVNDEVITLSELDTTLQAFMKRIEEIPEGGQREKIVAQARVAALDKLIDNMLLEQKAAKLDIIVTDEDVAKSMSGMLSGKNISVEKFEETLSKEGNTLDEYRDEIRKNIITGRLVEKEIRSRTTITEKEIGEYYSKNRDKYEGKEATRIQQILLVKPKDGDNKTREKLRTKAEMILKKMKDGESFDLLVNEYSQGPAAGSGGDLGFVEKGMMFPAVDTAVFGLKKGETSGVIESPVGFHIIRVLDKRGAGIKPSEEVRDEIVREIGNEKVKKKFQEWLKELREKSLVEIKL
ncbi:MAG: peptidylprolyl isomerase [Deltaproteobacteria bacterium]|nr:peptidylprolyl isomerase [Deltaproteobacteria bacterium]MBW2650336.1 peptidylprolyl isomerase [Deltaproteobacteria bacterium]